LISEATKKHLLKNKKQHVGCRSESLITHHIGSFFFTKTEDTKFCKLLYKSPLSEKNTFQDKVESFFQENNFSFQTIINIISLPFGWHSSNSGKKAVCQNQSLSSKAYNKVVFLPLKNVYTIY
jgi:hypothetical protein